MPQVSLPLKRVLLLLVSLDLVPAIFPRREVVEAFQGMIEARAREIRAIRAEVARIAESPEGGAAGQLQLRQGLRQDRACAALLGALGVHSGLQGMKEEQEEARARADGERRDIGLRLGEAVANEGWWFRRLHARPPPLLRVEWRGAQMVLARPVGMAGEGVRWGAEDEAEKGGEAPGPGLRFVIEQTEARAAQLALELRRAREQTPAEARLQVAGIELSRAEVAAEERRARVARLRASVKEAEKALPGLKGAAAAALQEREHHKTHRAHRRAGGEEHTPAVEVRDDDSDDGDGSRQRARAGPRQHEVARHLGRLEAVLAAEGELRAAEAVRTGLQEEVEALSSGLLDEGSDAAAGGNHKGLRGAAAETLRALAANVLAARARARAVRSRARRLKLRARAQAAEVEAMQAEVDEKRVNARGLRAGGDKAAAEAMLREVEELKARLGPREDETPAAAEEDAAGDLSYSDKGGLRMRQVVLARAAAVVVAEAAAAEDAVRESAGAWQAEHARARDEEGHVAWAKKRGTPEGRVGRDEEEVADELREVEAAMAEHRRGLAEAEARLGEAGQTVVALLQEMDEHCAGVRRAAALWRKKALRIGERVRAAEADGAGEDLLVLEGCVLARARLEEALERTAEVEGATVEWRKQLEARLEAGTLRVEDKGGEGRTSRRPSVAASSGSGWTGSLEGSEREARVASRQADVQGRLEARRAAVRRRLSVLRSAGARAERYRRALHVAEHEASYEDFVALVVRLASRPAAGSASAAARPLLPAPAARAPRARVRWRQATRGAGAHVRRGLDWAAVKSEFRAQHMLPWRISSAALRPLFDEVLAASAAPEAAALAPRDVARLRARVDQHLEDHAPALEALGVRPRVRIPGLFPFVQVPTLPPPGTDPLRRSVGRDPTVGASRVGLGVGAHPGGAEAEAEAEVARAGAEREAEMLERVLVARRRRQRRIEARRARLRLKRRAHAQQLHSAAAAARQAPVADSGWLLRLHAHSPPLPAHVSHVAVSEGAVYGGRAVLPVVQVLDARRVLLHAPEGWLDPAQRYPRVANSHPLLALAMSLQRPSVANKCSSVVTWHLGTLEEASRGMRVRLTDAHVARDPTLASLAGLRGQLERRVSPGVWAVQWPSGSAVVETGGRFATAVPPGVAAHTPRLLFDGVSSALLYADARMAVRPQDPAPAEPQPGQELDGRVSEALLARGCGDWHRSQSAGASGAGASGARALSARVRSAAGWLAATGAGVVVEIDEVALQGMEATAGDGARAEAQEADAGEGLGASYGWERQPPGLCAQLREELLRALLSREAAENVAAPRAHADGGAGADADAQALRRRLRVVMRRMAEGCGRGSRTKQVVAIEVLPVAAGHAGNRPGYLSPSSRSPAAETARAVARGWAPVALAELLRHLVASRDASVRTQRCWGELLSPGAGRVAVLLDLAGLGLSSHDTEEDGAGVDWSSLEAEVGSGVESVSEGEAGCGDLPSTAAAADLWGLAGATSVSESDVCSACRGIIARGCCACLGRNCVPGVAVRLVPAAGGGSGHLEAALRGAVGVLERRDEPGWWWARFPGYNAAVRCRVGRGADAGGGDGRGELVYADSLGGARRAVLAEAVAPRARCLLVRGGGETGGGEGGASSHSESWGFAGAAKGKYLQVGGGPQMEVVKVAAVDAAPRGRGGPAEGVVALTVLRARFKTAPAAHAAGAEVVVYQPSPAELRQQLGLSAAGAEVEAAREGAQAKGAGSAAGEAGGGAAAAAPGEVLVSSETARVGEWVQIARRWLSDTPQQSAPAFGGGGKRRVTGRYQRLEGRVGRLTRPGLGGCWYASFDVGGEEAAVELLFQVSGGVSVLAYVPGFLRSERAVHDSRMRTESSVGAVALPGDEGAGEDGVDVRLLFEVNLALGAGDQVVLHVPGVAARGEAVQALERERRKAAAALEREAAARAAAAERRAARRAARETAGELVSDDERSGDEEEAPAVHGAEALGLGAGAGEDLLAGMEVFVDDKAAVTTAADGRRLRAPSGVPEPLHVRPPCSVWSLSGQPAGSIHTATRRTDASAVELAGTFRGAAVALFGGGDRFPPPPAGVCPPRPLCTRARDCRVAARRGYESNSPRLTSRGTSRSARVRS